MGRAVEDGGNVLADSATVLHEGVDKIVASCRTFLRARLEAVFEEQGFAHDEIQASLVDFDDVRKVLGLQ